MSNPAAVYVDLRQMRLEQRRQADAADPDIASVTEVRVNRTEEQSDQLANQVRNSTATSGLSLLLKEVNERRGQEKKQENAKDTDQTGSQSKQAKPKEKDGENGPKK